MDGDGDFSSYMVARWPGLIRTLVLLGCRYAEAERVARDGLARCHDSWAKDRESDDIDVHVYRVVLERLAQLRKRERQRPQRPDEAEPPLLLDPTQADPAQRLALRRALEVGLARCLPEERTVLVLRFVAELIQVQVADVLDVPVVEVQERQAAGLSRLDLDGAAGGPVSEYLAGEIFREAGEGVPVGQPPVDDVLAMARDRRRRRLTWGAGVVAATVAALGIGTWVGTRPAGQRAPGRDRAVGVEPGEHRVVRQRRAAPAQGDRRASRRSPRWCRCPTGSCSPTVPAASYSSTSRAP